MTSDERVRISWRRNTDTRYPYGPVSADVDYLEPLGFPPPWPSRPWIYANVITSKNGVVAWTRAGPHDDPVRVIAGGDFTRTGRRADLQLMRYLRACADAVSVGAQTLRDQPDLIGTAEDIGAALGAALSRFRSRQGWPRVPLQVVYSQSGWLDLDVPMFTTPGLTAIIVTTDGGARLLRGRGSEGKGIRTICAGETQVDSVGLVRAHERLFEEFGVRYLACEGGANVLASLHQAGILDEIFVTSTDVAVEPSEHEGITRIFAFEAPAACLIGEGEVASDSGYAFRRWRFNKRSTSTFNSDWLRRPAHPSVAPADTEHRRDGGGVPVGGGLAAAGSVDGAGARADRAGGVGAGGMPAAWSRGRWGPGASSPRRRGVSPSLTERRRLASTSIGRSEVGPSRTRPPRQCSARWICGSGWRRRGQKCSTSRDSTRSPSATPCASWDARSSSRR